MIKTTSHSLLPSWLLRNQRIYCWVKKQFLTVVYRQRWQKYFTQQRLGPLIWRKDSYRTGPPDRLHRLEPGGPMLAVFCQPSGLSRLKSGPKRWHQGWGDYFLHRELWSVEHIVFVLPIIRDGLYLQIIDSQLNYFRNYSKIFDCCATQRNLALFHAQ